MNLFSQVENLRKQKDVDKYIKNLEVFKKELSSIKVEGETLKAKIKTDVANDNFVVTDFVKLAKIFERRQELKRQQPNIKTAITKLQEVATALGA